MGSEKNLKEEKTGTLEKQASHSLDGFAVITRPRQATAPRNHQRYSDDT